MSYKTLIRNLRTGRIAQFKLERADARMMKSTGIVRKIDELGRIVIPSELRKTLGIGEKQELEIYVDGERIMLKKYAPACIFCGSEENVGQFKGKTVCQVCRGEMRA